VNWSSIYTVMIVGGAIVALNLRFLIANIRLAKKPDSFGAWKVFKLSASYLFLTLILIVIGHIL
jgi:heme O synthase-like polyprenyltransferase